MTMIDIHTQERHAYAAGDYERAELLGALIDAEAEVERMEEAEAEETGRLRGACERYEEQSGDVKILLLDLRQLVEEAARVSNRGAMLAKLQQALDVLDRA